MASETTPLNGNEEEHVGAKLARHVSNMHEEAHKHAKNATPWHPDHEEGQAPGAGEALAAGGAFAAIMGAPLCCVASIFLIIGHFALQYAGTATDSAQCPFPLATLLTYYAYCMLAVGGIMIIGMCCPCLYACIICLQPVIQLIGLAMLIATLLSYAKAAECGQSVWWACLVLSNPPIACIIYCCCSPFGQAKAAALLGFKTTKAAHWAATEVPYKTGVTGAV